MLIKWILRLQGLNHDVFFPSWTRILSILFFFFLEWIICYFFKCVYCIIPIVYRPNYFASWISANFCFNKNFSYKWIYTKASLNSDGWKFRSKLFLTSKMNHCQDVNWKFWTHHSNYRPWWRQKIVKTFFFLKKFSRKVPDSCPENLSIWVNNRWTLISTPKCIS